VADALRPRGRRAAGDPAEPDGTLQLDAIPALFDARTRLLAITQVSNVLGTENPLAALIPLAHQHGAKVLVDGAQAVMHHAVDVQALDCDFMFSPATSCMARPGLACCMSKRRCCRRCRRGKGAGQ
jgi:cysteine desulfurase/selenocysteine lyase